MAENISVRIFGSTYTLQTNGNEVQTQAVATRVDEQMQTLARDSGITSPLKLAILTALNFAYELETRSSTPSSDVETVLSSIERRLNDSLQQRQTTLYEA